MKTICITGNSQRHIEEVSANLQSAGLLPALPSKRDPEITLRVWHENVLQSHKENTKIKNIGNIWEQMAIDIFLANHKQDLWHWAEKDSMLLADYWIKFDTGIHFVLVHTPLAEYLKLKLDTPTAATSANIEDELKNWECYTKFLLELREKHPQRTTLVTSSIVPETYNDLIAELNKKLRSDLHLLPNWLSDNKLDPTLNYFIQDLLAEQSELLELDKRAHKNTPNPEKIQPLVDALNYYLDVKNSSTNLASLTSNTIQITTSPPAVKKSTELQDKISELVSENELILFHLHETQEEYEQHLLEIQPIYPELQLLTSRLNKVLEQYPGYWEYDSAKISALSNKNAISWAIKNTFLNNRKLDSLNFETTLIEDGVSLSLAKSSDMDAPLVKWPAGAGQVLDFSSVNAKTGHLNALNWLGPTDWDSIKFLVNRIVGFCQSDLAHDSIPPAMKENLYTGMQAFQKDLEQWPLTFRYDAIELKEIVQFGEYHALGIALKNVRVGSSNWSSFEYRLATFHEAGKEFGAFPRLEFPEACRDALQSWYPESTDERGARLELRFSQPDAMDTMVWSKLAGNDQLLIAALLVNLNIQLNDLKAQNPTISVQWNTWQGISDFMKSTLTKIYHAKKP